MFLSLELGIPVNELLARVSSADLAEYMAYYQVDGEMKKEALTKAELEAKAKANLNGNNSKPRRRRNR